jgi:hypothetical protein
MNLLCRSETSVTRRNAVATRLATKPAKSLKVKQRGSRNAVATWRNAAGAKSLRKLATRRNAAGSPYLRRGREARLAASPFPSPFHSIETPKFNAEGESKCI